MRIRKSFGLATTLGLLLVGLGLAGRGVGAAESPEQATVRRMRGAVATRPADPTTRFWLALSLGSAGDARACAEQLDSVLVLGDGFLPARNTGFEPVWNDTLFRGAVRRLEAALPRRTEAAVAFRLDRNLIPEGIAHHASSGATYVGSIAQRKIVRVDGAGRARDFSRPGELDCVLGLAIDGNRLYAVHTNAFTDEGEKERRNRVAWYDLSSGRKVNDFSIPAARSLNDVAIGPGGTVFVTDTFGGAVYRVGDGEVTAIVEPNRLPGANGIAIAADSSALYVAHNTGVARVPLGATEDTVIARLPLPPRQGVGAIDGLYLRNGALVGIQNVTNPGRLVRLTLSANGRAIERVETLLSHHHEAIDEPTTGTFHGDAFLMLATTQVARFNRRGGIDDPETLKAPVVLRVPLGAR